MVNSNLKFFQKFNKVIYCICSPGARSSPALSLIYTSALNQRRTLLQTLRRCALSHGLTCTSAEMVLSLTPVCGCYGLLAST